MSKLAQKNLQNRVIFSFFAGAGFLDLGFELSGFKVAFVNELNNSFLNAYKFARSKMGIPGTLYGYHEGDMVGLTKGKQRKNLSNIINDTRRHNGIVGFIGGPPCPDFSVAGKNKGRNGVNGKLSSTYVTLISQQNPDFFLFENVKGLWKTRTHRQFYEELKIKLQKKGYVLTERLINALEYGAPQDRERIILVGFQKDLIPPKLIDPGKKNTLATNAFPWSEYIKFPLEEIIKKYGDARKLYEKHLHKKPWGIPAETTVQYWFEKNLVTKHPNARHFFKPKVPSRFKEIREGDVSRKSFKKLHRWRYSPTVAYGNNEVHLHPFEPRRLSAAEALALQSLPKDFVFPDTMTLSEMFKAIGNGVPFVVAKSVAGTINKFLDTLIIQPYRQIG